MLGRRPFIRKLSDLLMPGGRPAPSDAVGSPRSPLDLKLQSPRGLRGYDLDGVGLGIVAALETSGEDVPGKHCVRSLGLGRTGRAPLGKGEGCAGVVGGGFEDVEVNCLENYTYVTCHGPNEFITKVYYDGGLDWPGEHKRSCHDGVAADCDHGVSRELFSSEEDVTVFQTLDFLSSCNLCGKKLHDRDIYMYRGEKAFCSTDCRSRQIAMDERKEQKCRNEASKAADLSSSPYTEGRIFSTGIVAI